MYKIAICDDDKRYRKTIREIIEHENSLPENEIRFYEYESGNELLKHTDILHELVFIDIRMPGLDGNQTALKLRNYNKDAVLIFYSSYFEPTVEYKFRTALSVYYEGLTRYQLTPGNCSYYD